MSLTFHANFAEDESLVPRIGPTISYVRTGDARYWDSSGILQTASGGVPRYGCLPVAPYTKLGLFFESNKSNLCLWNRDFTNAVWVASNITPVKDATGPDAIANSASTLTATANSGTIKQTITVASDNLTTSVFMKRKTGTGTVEITDNDFINATDITADINSSTWTQVGKINRTQANPVVGIRLGTSGDEVEVDFMQTEDREGHHTSPIATTTAVGARGYDLGSIPTASWLANGVGTYYVDCMFAVLKTNPSYILSGYGSFLRVAYSAVSSVRSYDGVATRNWPGGAPVVWVRDRLVCSYSETTGLMYGYRNGLERTPVTFAGGGIWDFATLYLGGYATSSGIMNGFIREVRYYDELLPFADQEAMSNGVFPSAGGGRIVTGPGLSFGSIGKLGA